jgi:hypothetical protein
MGKPAVNKEQDAVMNESNRLVTIAHAHVPR